MLRLADFQSLLYLLLFACRRIQQESTGFSPFQLLYGRDITGPLDILKESNRKQRWNDLNVIVYIMLMRGRLEEMSEYVHKNMQLAQTWQKSWYEKDTRERSFQHGTSVNTGRS